MNERKTDIKKYKKGREKRRGRQKKRKNEREGK